MSKEKQEKEYDSNYLQLKSCFLEELKNGTDINYISTETGTTMLTHLLFYTENKIKLKYKIDLTNMLIELGADIYLRDNKGNIPIKSTFMKFFIKNVLSGKMNNIYSRTLDVLPNSSV